MATLREPATLFEAALGRLGDVLTPGSFLEATPESLVVAEAGGEIVYANAACERLTGFAHGELLGRPVGELLASDLVGRAAGSSFETTCTRRDGRELPVEVHVGRIEATSPLLVVTLRDRTEMEAGRAAQFEAEAKYRALVEHIPAVVYLDPVDENSESIYVSPQVVELLGIGQDEWLTDPYAWRHHVHPDDIERAWDEYRHAYNAHEPLNHEYRMVHEDGSIRWVLEQAYPIDDEQGDPWLIQGVIFDITERKLAEEQVAFLAYHDKLTGLPNRALFEEMLEAAISRARRHDLGVGVIYLDLDNFKLVNDSLGHHAGDDLLKQLAERLRGCTRETDLVARQGGDEFLLLLADLERGIGPVAGTEAGLLVAESVATRVHEALQEPFDLGGVEFFTSASLGVSLFPQDATDAISLLKNADTAMYQSKKAEPGGYIVYASGADEAIERLSLTTRLRRAVEQKHWVLHWQPIVELEGGTVTGLEALIRWSEPNGGIVPPGEFIPIAEELGLIEAIGDWVIDELAHQRKVWEAQGIRRASRLQPVAPPALVGAVAGEADGEAHGGERGSPRRGRRDHGIDRDGRPRPHAAGPRRPPRVGALARDRRLRDGVFLARPAEAPARRHPQDRSLLHPCRRSRRRLRPHGRGDDPAGARPGHGGARGGDRDRGRARLPPGGGLHPRPGIPVLARRPGGARSPPCSHAPRCSRIRRSRPSAILA